AQALPWPPPRSACRRACRTSSSCPRDCLRRRAKSRPYWRTSACQPLLCASPTGGLVGALETGTSLGTRGVGMSSGEGSPGGGAAAGVGSGFGFCCVAPGVSAFKVLPIQVPWFICGLTPPDFSSVWALAYHCEFG